MQAEQQAKIAAMKAIMGNPKLASIIEDGINSPISSTKRQKANAVISVITKASAGHSVPKKMEDLLNHAKKINNSKNSYKKIYDYALSKDGKGGPVQALSSGTTTSTPETVLNRAPSTQNASNFSVNQQQGFPGLLQKAGSGLASLVSKTGRPLLDYASMAIAGSAARGEQAARWLTGSPVSFGETLGAHIAKPFSAPYIKTSPPAPKTPAELGMTLPPSVPSPSREEETPVPEAEIVDDQGPYDPYDYWSQVGTGTIPENPLTGTIYERYWDEIPKDIQDSLKSTLTGGAFATITMADREKLRALFPGLSPEQIPWGAGLQGQIDDLRNRLREEFKLDQIANEKEQLIRSGATLFNDLTDYVRGRDTFIKSVDEMMDRVRDNVHTGPGDPASIKANNMYMDYLTVLKGRQNQRYIELLNTSIDNYNKKVEHITNEYNSKFAEYKDVMERSAEITIAQYSQMFNDLAGMWTLVSEAPAMVQERAMQQAEIDQLNAKTLKDLQAAQEESELNLNLDLEAYKKYVPIFLDKDGKLKENTDLFKDLQAAIGSGGQLNIATFTRMMQDGINASDNRFTTIDSIRDMIRKFEEDGGNDLMMQITAFIDPQTGTITSPYIDPNTGKGNFSEHLYAMLGRKTVSAMNSAVRETDWPEIQKAISWLSQYDRDAVAGGKKRATKTNFDKNYASLADVVRDTMWEYYVQSLNDPVYNKDKPSRASIFRNDLEGFKAQIASFLSRSR